LVVALNVCSGCTTKFAVGLPRCPHCGSTEYVEDGDPMAKISRHGGASDKTLPVPEPEAEAVDVTAPETSAELDGLDVTEYLAGPVEPASETEGGEEPSPGSSSSASTEMPRPNSEPSKSTRRKPARKTVSRSGQGPTESSSAPSTGGDPETGTSATTAPDGEGA
jgi:hypothetical protein